MDGYASTAGHLQSVSNAPVIEQGKLRDWLAERFEHTYGRSPQRKQLSWMVMLMRWAAWAAGDGTVIDRSVPQIARGLGVPVGPNVRATQQRYRNQFYNTFGYLEGMGLCEGVCEAPRGADGRGTCILVRLPAGVAQSVRAALKRVRRFVAPLRRPLSWGGFAVPLRASTNVSRFSAVCVNPEAVAGARARFAVDAHGPPSMRPRSSRANWGTTATSRGRGPVFAAVAAWQEWNPGVPWRLSRRGELLIERYCAQLDELACRDGYGQAWLVNLINDTFEPFVSAQPLGYKPWDRDARASGGGAPRSLGYFVRLLRRHARRERKRVRRG